MTTTTTTAPAIENSADLLKAARSAARGVKAVTTTRTAIGRAIRGADAAIFAGLAPARIEAATAAVEPAIADHAAARDAVSAALADLESAPRVVLAKSDAATLGLGYDINGPKLAGLLRATLTGTKSGRDLAGDLLKI